MEKSTILASLLLLPILAASGCREACSSDELRYGDKCVLRPDAGTFADEDASHEEGVETLEGEGDAGDDPGSDASADESAGDAAEPDRDAGNTSCIDAGVNCTCDPPYEWDGETCACPTGYSGASCTQCAASHVRNDAGACVQAAKVTFTFAGDGFGRVNFSDATPPCTQTCTVTWPLGAARTMAAEAEPTSRIVGWNLPECAEGPCNVQAKTITTSISVTFELRNNVAFLLPTEHTAAEVGGLAGADALCSQAASEAGLHGKTFRAWLSAEGASTATSDDIHAIDRLAGARGWVRPDGYPVADLPSDLVTKGPLFPILVTPNGQRKLVSYYTWTGTGPDGRLARGVEDAALTCGDWWVGSDERIALAGVESDTGARWTQWHERSCSFKHTLYCFGIDTNAPMVTIPPVTGGRLVFVTKNSITLTEGIDGVAAMDALCAQEASAAQLSGTFKALVHTSAGVPTVRVSSTAVPWVRVDGVMWTDATHDLKNLRTGLLYADGTHDYQKYAVAFAGEPTRGYCQNWTSPLGSMFSYVTSNAGNYIYMSDSCFTPSRVVCVQD